MASWPSMYVNHVPALLEAALCSDISMMPPPKKRRRRKATAEERQAFMKSTAAYHFQRERCLFVFWGWCEEGRARSLDLASACSAGDSGASHGREISSFITLGCKRKATLRKWDRQAQRLSKALPSSTTLWLPSVPTSADRRSMTTVSNRYNALKSGQGGCERLATLTIVLPVGLPGMGKSTILEKLYSKCVDMASIAFRQGQAVTSNEAHEHSTTSDDRLASHLAAVSILSSDGFTGAELQARGVNAHQCPDQDMSECRRVASNHFRRGIEEFIEFVSKREADRLAAADGNEHFAAAVVSQKYILILDKNYPPSGLRRESEIISELAPRHVDLRLTAIKLMADPQPDAVELLETEEARDFGPWHYPWCPEVIAECAARLLLRSQHETLIGSENGLFILLSFCRLYDRQEQSGQVPGVRVIEVPALSLGPQLAAWPDATGKDSECVWRRFEVRALLRDALRVLQPFGDPHISAPTVAALVKCLMASGLHVPSNSELQAHLEQCSQNLLSALLAAPPVTRDFVDVSVRYAALLVDHHFHQLNCALQTITATLFGEQADQLLSSFARPRLLHMTTLFVGGGDVPATRRSLLGTSRSLHRQGAEFDCRITHIVYARGALAVAVVDVRSLTDAGVPCDIKRPHITLCYRSPWRPKHSNDVLAAAMPLISQATDEALPRPLDGCENRGTHLHMKALPVADSALDVFAVPLSEPLILTRNRLHLF